MREWRRKVWKEVEEMAMTEKNKVIIKRLLRYSSEGLYYFRVDYKWRIVYVQVQRTSTMYTCTYIHVLYCTLEEATSIRSITLS